jgi:hypothetical protein
MIEKFCRCSNNIIFFSSPVYTVLVLCSLFYNVSSATPQISLLLSVFLAKCLLFIRLYTILIIYLFSGVFRFTNFPSHNASKTTQFLFFKSMDQARRSQRDVVYLG